MSMKRFLMTAAAVCALVFASVAFAGTREYSGTIEPDSTMKFDALMRHHRVDEIDRFSWDGVRVRCTGGRIVATGSFDDPMRVHDRRFHGTLVGPDGAKVHVTGRFKHHFRIAFGTFRIHGDIDKDTHTDCHTGERDWTAGRV